MFYVDEVSSKVMAKLDGAVEAASPAKSHTEVGTKPINEEERLRRMAMCLLEGATAKSEAMGVPVVITVVDVHGNPVLAYRMADVLLVSTEISAGKAIRQWL